MTTLKDFLTQQEGISYNAYSDASGLTIGVGHFLHPEELSSGLIQLPSGAVKWRDGLTPAQVAELLTKDIRMVQQQMMKFVTVALTQGQSDAITDFIFNEGIGNFASSTLLKLINTKQFAAVPAELKKWNLSQGKIHQGLVARRAAEAAMWEGQ